MVSNAVGNVGRVVKDADDDQPVVRVGVGDPISAFLRDHPPLRCAELRFGTDEEARYRRARGRAAGRGSELADLLKDRSYRL